MASRQKGELKKAEDRVKNVGKKLGSLREEECDITTAIIYREVAAECARWRRDFYEASRQQSLVRKGDELISQVRERAAAVERQLDEALEERNEQLHLDFIREAGFSMSTAPGNFEALKGVFFKYKKNKNRNASAYRYAAFLAFLHKAQAEQNSYEEAVRIVREEIRKDKWKFHKDEVFRIPREVYDFLTTEPVPSENSLLLSLQHKP